MKVCIGDIFSSGATTIVNTVNCVGIMGKGIAQEFKRRYPDMFFEYELLCREHKLKPGMPYYYSDLTGASIINFPTKGHWRSPSKLSYVRDGLEWFRDNYEKLGITSVAFPPLGCGNGGLSWDDVGPLMYSMLSDLPIDVTIFAPYGTPEPKLKIDYLVSRPVAESSTIGIMPARINKEWLLIPYVIQQLNRGRYTLHVGRVIRQKICYVLTREGVNTGFKFTKGSYGPYSRDADAAVATLFNANIISERQNGPDMLESLVPDTFVLNLADYSPDDIMRVERTLDLFHRIKNTDQAEMLTTVMYAYDSLCVNNPDVTEADVLQFVLEWKPHWNSSRTEYIKRTINSLEMLALINPQISFDEEPAFA